jgi:hypothetical protein
VVSSEQSAIADCRCAVAPVAQPTHGSRVSSSMRGEGLGRVSIALTVLNAMCESGWRAAVAWSSVNALIVLNAMREPAGGSSVDRPYRPERDV